MDFRKWIGLGSILAGVLIQPIGWMYEFWLQILSFVLIFVGAFIFVTQKYVDKAVKEFNSGGRGRRGRRGRRGGPVMPGDIHDYSGWGKGGRSESYMSKSSSDGDGGGGE